MTWQISDPAQTRISSSSVVWILISPHVPSARPFLSPFSLTGVDVAAGNSLSIFPFPLPFFVALRTLTYLRSLLSLFCKISEMKGGAKSKAEQNKADSRLSVKRKASERTSKKPAKKAGKDPNKPKRAPSAFFVFLEGFRKEYKEKYPENKSVAAVGKAAGEKWKSMSDAEKAPFVNKSNKRKAELQKSVAASEKKQETSSNVVQEDESDKSKSEVNDEGDDESGEEEDDE